MFFNRRLCKITCLTTIITLLVHGEISGQGYSLFDTINIDEVVVRGAKPEGISSGFKNIKLDSSVLAVYSHMSLDELLDEQTILSIKSYGAGGVSTPSFRGTGAGHTQIMWNNININNPMLGQSDLAIIPAGIIDEAEILFGGASLQTGSGGIGGAITLNNKPEWNKKTSATISSAIGSFGHYSGIIKVKTGGAAFQSVTRAYASYAENNYTYINKVRSAEPVRERMQNSRSFQKGLMQELYFKHKDNVISGKLWYQSADRNLPANMLVSRVGHDENQVDESLRMVLSYDGKLNATEYYATGAYSRMELNYINKPSSIDSYNQSDSYTFKTGMTNRIGSKIKTGVIIEEEYTTVNSVNYENDKARKNNVAIIGQAGFNDGGLISLSALIKETVIDEKMYAPDFSTGLKLRLNGADEHFIKANFAKVSKFPSMNDLFWVPGGNPQLKNEIANMFEAAYKINGKLNSSFFTGLEVTYYNNSIKNLIQWIPGQYSYWMAENIRKANCSGIETSGKVKYSRTNFFASVDVSYSYNRSTTKESDINNDKSIGKQLVYVPKNQVGAFVKVGFRDLSLLWISDFTGERFTTSDNTLSLPFYTLNSLSAGYVLRLKSMSYNINFKVSNIFDVAYQSIEYYAQPGRSYSLKLIINL